jgi:hypothetical protein
MGSGRAFYRRAREGGRWSCLAPASFTVPPLMPHSAAEGTLRRGGTGEDAGQGGGRSGAKLPCAARWQRGGRRRRPEVTSVKRRQKDDEATDQRGHFARGSERARERAADGWGRLASERFGAWSGLACARGGRPKMGRERRSAGAWEGRGRGFGPEAGPAGRGESFSLFLFHLNLLFPILPLFF